MRGRALVLAVEPLRSANLDFESLGEVGAGDILRVINKTGIEHAIGSAGCHEVGLCNRVLLGLHLKFNHVTNIGIHLVG